MSSPERAHSAAAVSLPPPRLRITEQAIPGFLMSVPLALSAERPNNARMHRLAPGRRRIFLPRALRQFRELYAFLAAHSLVYLLPTRPGLQDQTYVASLGAVLAHLPEPTLVVSSFRSEPRRGEREAGIAFFEALGVRFEPAPAFFEGEADLKPLGGNVYVGAEGLRTSESALRWLERGFDMELIRFPMRNELFHHLDCALFPLTREEVLVCTAVADPGALRAIERRASVIDVSLSDAASGITSCVRIGRFVLCASSIDELDSDDEAYPLERSKIMALDEICAKRSLTPVFFDLSEFSKSGARLSSLILHLNHANF
jgi:N-dimethylarginine dimethylaminohydrolase